MGVAHITHEAVERSPAGMYAPERRRAIAAMATARGRVVVNQLAEHFQVAPETIRRDLDELDRSGILDRVHGGAIPRTSHGTQESTAAARRTTRSEQKTRIAAAALEHLPAASGSILLDGGTTTGLLAEAIAARPGPASQGDGLTVITNALGAGLVLASAQDVRVRTLGGQLRAVTETVVGETAVKGLEEYVVDVAFLGANGLSARYGATTPDAQEAAVKSAMCARARRVVLLADSSKFDTDYLCAFAPFSRIDILITDRAPEAELAQALHAHDIEVVLA